MDKYARITLRLTPFQLKQLKKEKKQTGSSVSSIIRRCVNAHVLGGIL